MSQTSLRWKVRSSLTRAGLWRWVERSRLFGRLLLRKPHEPDFEYFKRFEGRDGLFVDVGANIGQSAISFRAFNRSYRILSFEPNPQLEPELRFVGRLLGSAFSYRVEGLGRQTEIRKFFYPEANGVPLTQEGSPLEGHFAGDPAFLSRLREATGQTEGKERYETSSLELKIVALDSLGLKPDVIKLDVQGFELEALDGMRATIEASQPILMIENGPGMGAVAEFLKKASYGEPCFYDRRSGSLVETTVGDPRLNLFFTTPARR